MFRFDQEFRLKIFVILDFIFFDHNVTISDAGFCTGISAVWPRGDLQESLRGIFSGRVLRMIKFMQAIKSDFAMVFDRDPAARSRIEIVLCYPGLHALVLYRIAHAMWNNHLKLFGRCISHFARWITGIEIHPGAKIGKRFFIDHGMGIVIGETVEVGDDCTLYQGVTLGGTSWSKGKRHPTLHDRVIVGAGAIVLGPVTIGNDSRIGSSSVVINDVPPFSTVVGIPGKVIRRRDPIIKKEGDYHFDLQHATLPDPFGDAIQGLRKSVDELERRLIDVERKTQ
ncbi:MAG: Serine acetyltransferase [bacterium ADurb.Bin270]|nr:serine O-acetyltransferase [Myxococcales bacterium]OQA59077.1 MAG: Serine acetyltransferase [bacterium ADurb.Bin270]